MNRERDQRDCITVASALLRTVLLIQRHTRSLVEIDSANDRRAGHNVIQVATFTGDCTTRATHK
jgi:hypothetical protein